MHNKYICAKENALFYSPKATYSHVLTLHSLFLYIVSFYNLPSYLFCFDFLYFFQNSTSSTNTNCNLDLCIHACFIHWKERGGRRCISALDGELGSKQISRDERCILTEKGACTKSWWSGSSWWGQGVVK